MSETTTDPDLPLSPTVRGLDQSATLAIKQRAAELTAQGHRIFRLGLGQSPFPVPEPVVEALRRHAGEKDYLPVRGLGALRAAVADFHRREDKVEAQPDRVLIGPGSKELMFLVQLVFSGDILIPSPSWVSYVPQARILGRTPTTIEMDFAEGWKIGPDRLAAACHRLAGGERTCERHLLILNYPNNPVGNSYAVEELEALAEIARQHGLYVLSDEIYGQLHFEGEHVSIARFYPEGTIISSGLSKWCGAGGWRLGTFTFPERLRWLQEAMAAVASETYTSVSAQIQHAAVTAFHGGARIERYLTGTRRILRALGRHLREILLRGGIDAQLPEGGFYLFLDFGRHAGTLAAHGLTTSAALADRLLVDTGVAILPGEPFGRPPGELTARLAFVDFDGAAALAASRGIPLERELPEEFLAEQCGEVLRAAELIVGWLTELE